MKTSFFLPVVAILTLLPCKAQPTNVPTPAPPAIPHPHERLENALEKMQGMTPDQQASFLKIHPRLAAYLQGHPNIAKGISSGSEGGPGIKDPGHPLINEVNQREAHLENRITQGVANGTLNPQQASTVQTGINQIQQQEAKDIQQNGGHLTAAECGQLNHEANKAKHEIKKSKR